MTEPQQIWERSHEVDDLLGKQPAWITRWGMVVFLIFIVLLLTGSWIIRYPDMLVSQIVVASENPPATLVARASGSIEGLYTSDQEAVPSGKVLIYLGNPARYDDIITLSEDLEGFSTDSIAAASFLAKLEAGEKVLGEVQEAYAGLRLALQQYVVFLQVKEYPVRVKALREKEKKTRAYTESLRTQSRVRSKDELLGRKQYLRDTLLFSQGVISASDLERSESQYLQKKAAYEDSRVNLAGSQIQVSQLEEEIIQQSLQYIQTRNALVQGMEKAFENLRNQIKMWRQRYLLVSPVAGRINFHSYFNLHQYVKEGEKVLSVVPQEKSVVYARMSLGGEGAGKVKPGQRVNIKFADYPFMEFGTVEGLVSSKSLLPQDQVYIIEVSLPKGLVSSYGKQLEYQPEMSGTAEIITENVRLLERLIQPLHYLISRR